MVCEDVNVETLDLFMTSLAELTEYDDFVADIFVRSPTRFELVELNEFDEFTDPVVFDWEDLKKR